MHVARLLHALLRIPDHEIVESALPDVGWAECSLSKGQLVWVARGPNSTQDLAGKTLLEDLHDSGRSGASWLTDQKVDVVGHDHIPGYDETIAGPYLLEDGEKQVMALRAAQQGRRW
jgi:hypothetical protein